MFIGLYEPIYTKRQFNSYDELYNYAMENDYKIFSVSENVSLEYFKDSVIELENYEYMDFESMFIVKGHCPSSKIYSYHYGDRLEIIINNNFTLIFEESEIIYKKEVCRFLLGNLIHYQNKGANSRYYVDTYEDNLTAKITYNEVLLDYRRYFSRNSKIIKHQGYKFHGDSNLSNKELSNNFRKNILINFREGLNFIYYM